jgi:hypothetical protein
METCSRTLAVALVTAIIISPFAHPVLAQGEELSDPLGLSPYWKPVVSRWERIVVRYAEQRHIDPDLVASVIWKESRGISTVRGPTGAVGLMCIKPYPWRPSADELENPWTNVAAGTRTLAQVIQDGNGDVYYALAAYNGGWGQIHIRVTRSYATDVLDNYARAVAVEHGLPADGDWIAIISVEGLPDHRTVTVLGPDRPLARYTERPWVRADVPSVPGSTQSPRSTQSPDDFPPHATLISFTDERGREAHVSLWLVTQDHASQGSFAVIPTSTQSFGIGTSTNSALRQDLDRLPD